MAPDSYLTRDGFTEMERPNQKLGDLRSWPIQLPAVRLKITDQHTNMRERLLEEVTTPRKSATNAI